MGERLRQVPDEPLREWIVLFGQQPDIVAERGETNESLAGPSTIVAASSTSVARHSDLPTWWSRGSTHEKHSCESRGEDDQSGERVETHM